MMNKDQTENAVLAGLGDSDDDDASLTLTVEEARMLNDRELHQRVRTIVQDLEATFGRGVLPTDLPWRVSAMTRAELIQAVEDHAYWFDPQGGHPYPGTIRQI